MGVGVKGDIVDVREIDSGKLDLEIRSVVWDGLYRAACKYDHGMVVPVMQIILHIYVTSLERKCHHVKQNRTTILLNVMLSVILCVAGGGVALEIGGG